MRQARPMRFSHLVWGFAWVWLFFSGPTHGSSIEVKYIADFSPARKLQFILKGTDPLYRDKYTEDKTYRGVERGRDKRWMVADPSELLRRHPADALASIMTLAQSEGTILTIPDFINSPDYGPDWGTRAIYTELNPRAVARMEALSPGERRQARGGLMQLLKLLPAIPPSRADRPHCLILSQLYAAVDGDSWISQGDEERSLYTIKLGVLSENLYPHGLKRDSTDMSAEDLIKAFNDLAHLLGFKTGFRMLVSEDQLRLGERRFEWWKGEDREAFIEALVKGVNLGFDAIYVDSGRHIGFRDWQNYSGVGAVPQYHEWQYITYEARRRSHKPSLAIIGEKADGDVGHFGGMGLTAGTDWSNPDDPSSMKWEGEQQERSGRSDYRAGPDVSNDNESVWSLQDGDGRLRRMKNVLFNNPYKLPSFMQMTDFFPLNQGTSSHDLMLRCRDYSENGVPETHWNNLFDHGATSQWYRARINEDWAHFLNN